MPVYPGAQQIGGPPSSPQNLGVTSEGRTGWATDDSLLNIQMFYFVRLTNGGWQEVAQLPGQYPSQFQGNDREPITMTLPVPEFSRGDTAQRVRIVAEAAASPSGSSAARRSRSPSIPSHGACPLALRATARAEAI